MTVGAELEHIEIVLKRKYVKIMLNQNTSKIK